VHDAAVKVSRSSRVSSLGHQAWPLTPQLAQAVKLFSPGLVIFAFALDGFFERALAEAAFGRASQGMVRTAN
jgi:hypothetical protein